MKLEEMKITELFDTSHTIAAKLFEGKTYPWEVLENIGSHGRSCHYLRPCGCSPWSIYPRTCDYWRRRCSGKFL